MDMMPWLSLRVLHLIGSTDPRSGGPIEAIFRQEAATTQDVATVREIASLDSPTSPWLTGAAVKTHALGRTDAGRSNFISKLLARWQFSPAYINWLKSNVARFDVIIVHGVWNYSSFGASRVLPKAGIPYFCFTHGMMDPWFRKRYPLKHIAKQIFWWIGDGRLLSKATGVLFTCEEECRLARGEFMGHRYKAMVVDFGTSSPPDPADNEAQLVEMAIPKLGENPYLLFLGRIHEKKGCDLLVRSFAQVAKNQPNLQLVIAGPDDTGIVDMLKSIPISDDIFRRIHFPGAIYGAQKWALLRLADAFVLSSHQENFGIAVAEALSCGTPVLISDKVNIWREIFNAGAGLVAPDTLVGTEDMLQRWIDTTSRERASMAAGAKRLFASKFDVKKTAPALLERLSKEIR